MSKREPNKKVKIRKGGKWVEVGGDEVGHAGRKFIKFKDEDGLTTYWLA